MIKVNIYCRNKHLISFDISSISELPRKGDILSFDEIQSKFYEVMIVGYCYYKPEQRNNNEPLVATLIVSNYIE